MKQKQCFKCKETKTLNNFYKHPETLDGHVGKCKNCNKVDVKVNYSKKKEFYNEYDKNRQKYSIKRIFDHRFNGIQKRSSKKSKRKYFVTGKKVLSRLEYDKWCKNNMKDFNTIYKNWVNSNFDFKLSPSIDRIDSKKSYLPENMQWLSKSDNCIKYNK